MGRKQGKEKKTPEQHLIIPDELAQLCEKAKSKNIKMCYHHHMGTGVMTMYDVGRLAEVTDPNLVSICLDTGHLHFAGGDCLDFINLYSDRITLVHL